MIFMQFGTRLKQARKHRGLTQKELGMMVGFDEKTADVRIAQYESETRLPKEELRDKMAAALNINPRYLRSYEGFCAEDILFLLFELDDEVRLRLSKPDPLEREINIVIPYGTVNDFLKDWMKVKQALADETITKEDYNEWKLTWPYSASQTSHPIHPPLP